MRKALLAAMALAGMAVFGTGSAEARDYRYCLVEGFAAGPGTCYYDNYAQCMASASGRRAYCQVNPVFAFAEQGRYADPGARVVKPRKVRRHHRHYYD
ncbi:MULTISPECIES: DUF3551 domain-containing protein [unclassified Afipia]|jgi:hypothetical protein|uniref:DUF3551 domain-containing protein n=1 Tax=unclassified Afipia TaxID=2642050 RepID=UPI0003F69772|nr:MULTISPECIES: DUF3551 domain-containing protein [unclassified Afipia]MBS4002283.1 DUF3551 domain-containing protein [Afipia sp.]WIG50289.1 MAG: hypothetical protein OJF48_001206 [Afipia sp.]